MKRICYSIELESSNEIKFSLLSLIENHENSIFLDSNSHIDKYSEFEYLAAWGTLSSLVCYDEKNSLQKLESYVEKTNDWVFGHCTYDVKNDIENLKSANLDRINFPAIGFFQPEKICFFRDGKLHFQYSTNFNLSDIKNDFKLVKQSLKKSVIKQNKIMVKSTISKSDYRDTFNQIYNNILLGNIYEINYCHEFIANGFLTPKEVFMSINSLSKSPFSTFYKIENKCVMCASPERYIKKKNDLIISQPIKGTAKRIKNKNLEIELLKKFSKDIKEITENTMIVDLVRNDLTKISLPGSVKVKEFCKIYSFSQVHQMISTIEAKIKNTLSFVDVLKATFPMGSMTGAPKISAMKYIEKYEKSKRGIYSGCIGYINPDKNFDFNVVIRSIIYNVINQNISIFSGGAITNKSLWEKEFDESIIKINALKLILENPV